MPLFKKSRENINNAVIKHLEEKNYKYIKPLGEGGFASVIAVRTPKKEVVAVKIIKKKNTCFIEDQVWPTLCHRNILPVLEVMEMKNPAVKLYMTPMLPKALDETVVSEEFRSDPRALMKIKIWANDVLFALDHLHSSGLCHCDLKSDNILIDQEERAILCDFSGLNYTQKPLDTVCSPEIFRPPECFRSKTPKNIQGEPYDMYTFGLTVLNVLTGHWLQRELHRMTHGDWAWPTHIWPTLEKVMQKSSFEYFLKSFFPFANISENDIEQALDFVQSLLKIQPEERPNVREIMKHPFLKMSGNPLEVSKENDFVPPKEDNIDRNPNRKSAVIKLDGNQVDSGQEVKPDVSKLKVFLPKNKAKPPQNRIRHFQPTMHRFIDVDDGDKKYNPRICLLATDFNGERNMKKVSYTKKKMKERVIGWFRKNFK